MVGSYSGPQGPYCIYVTSNSTCMEGTIILIQWHAVYVMCKEQVSALMDDEEEVEEVLERGMGMESSSESRRREVSGRVRVCWDLWGRVYEGPQGGRWGMVRSEGILAC